jgi:SAM-dependent methyltransferase
MTFLTDNTVAGMERPWYQELFAEDYLRVWGKGLTPERLERELTNLTALLALPTGSRILDLCCGHGRHAIPLALQGFEMTGLDLSAHFLERARGDADAAGVRVRWVESDMRRIPFEAEFDAIVNLFTAYGYFDQDEENLEVLRQVRKALKPGGVFLMDFINRERVVRRYDPQRIDRFEDGLIALWEDTFDHLKGRNDSRLTLLWPDGQRKCYSFSVRMYTPAELARMFETAGLRLEAYHGGLDGSPFGFDSNRLVLVARRPL